VWKDSEGKTKILIPSCPIFGSLSNHVAAPLDWSLVQLIAQLGNFVPFLALLADLAIAQEYP